MFNFLKQQKKEPQDLKEVFKEIKGLENRIEELSKELKDLKSESRFFLKKTGFIRYNPFSGVGSDQSFSLALLDDKNNGFIITSLFSREGNRVYAKAVEKGNSVHQLSDEEKEAIKKATEKND